MKNQITKDLMQFNDKHDKGCVAFDIGINICNSAYSVDDFEISLMNQKTHKRLYPDGIQVIDHRYQNPKYFTGSLSLHRKTSKYGVPIWEKIRTLNDYDCVVIEFTLVDRCGNLRPCKTYIPLVFTITEKKPFMGLVIRYHITDDGLLQCAIYSHEWFCRGWDYRLYTTLDSVCDRNAVYVNYTCRHDRLKILTPVKCFACDYRKPILP